MKLFVGKGYEQEDPGIFLYDEYGNVVVSSDVPLTEIMATYIAICVNTYAEVDALNKELYSALEKI